MKSSRSLALLTAGFLATKKQPVIGKIRAKLFAANLPSNQFFDLRAAKRRHLAFACRPFLNSRRRNAEKRRKSALTADQFACAVDSLCVHGGHYKALPNDMQGIPLHGVSHIK